MNVSPPHWYCGMKNPSLQIMITAKDIREAEITTDYEGVTIDALVRLDSPDYIFVYLDIADAKPGMMPLYVSLNGGITTLSYPLLQRDMPGEERHGFSNADVLYLLMPDRFAKGPAGRMPSMRYPYRINRKAPSLRHGGNIEGIRRHLDYLADLGVTALWLTPVLENDQQETKTHSSYHGYATTDYYRVDPRFGSNEDYRQLIREAHDKGLKIVMDMIFNHCGDNHPWVSDPPSDDWFNSPHYGLQTSYKLTPVVDPYASQIDHRETVDGWFVESMPDLNQRNPHLLTYLIQNSFWWIEYAGIDGIRMDTYPYADAKAMAEWMKRLLAEYPNFNVVGESWVTEPAFTAALQKDSRLNPNGNTFLPSVMDFAFYDRLSFAKGEDTDEWFSGLNRIYHTFVYDYLYPNPRSVLAFVDNHDTDRFLGKGRDVAALKQGMALLLTANRIPQIYYGTEILMRGTKERTDGDVRRDFPGGFPGDKRNAFTAKGRTKAEDAFFQWLRTILHWRKGNRVITEGRQIQFIPWKGVYVMAHVKEGNTVLLILNGTNAPATFLWQRYQEVIPAGTLAREVTSHRAYRLDRDIRLTPRQTLLLEYER